MKYIKLLKGLALVLAVALFSRWLSSLLTGIIQIEALTISIVLGMLIANTINIKEDYKPGITYSFKKLLKVGIVLLGFKLSFQTIVSIGGVVVSLVVVYIILALVLAIVLAKVFKVDKKLATLIGVGSSICGASAVVAMVPVINAKESDGLIAVSVVSILGSIGVIIYTVVFNVFNIEPAVYGLWSGLSLHGVAHSIAAAFAAGEVAGEIGTIVKMTRVLMLVPMSLVLSHVFSEGDKKGISVPVYILLFVGAVVVNSLGLIPETLVGWLGTLSSVFILLAMTGMGLSVHFNSLKSKAPSAIFLGTVLFIVLSVGSFFVIGVLPL